MSEQDDGDVAQDESELDRVEKPDWIAEVLGRVEFVEWDRFTLNEMDGYQFVDVYGWIDRDDDYKDFVWSRFWPETETVEYTTSSDDYSREIQRIWFGEDSLGDHNPCRRVENTFDVSNVVELDEHDLATDGGRRLGDGVSHNSSSDLPTIEFVTESGARRRIAYERVAENQRVVRRVSHYDDGGWRPVGQEELRSLEIDGEARSPVDLRTALSE